MNNTQDNAAWRNALSRCEYRRLLQNQSTDESAQNSLQATLTKRMSTGLTFLASYTYSKSIDNGSGQGGSARVGLGIINPSVVVISIGILGNKTSFALRKE